MKNINKVMQNLSKQLEKHRNNLAKERDAMRELMSEIEEIEGVCDVAKECLDEAIDTLSQYV